MKVAAFITGFCFSVFLSDGVMMYPNGGMIQKEPVQRN